MKLIYPAVFSPLEEQKGYCVTFPDLPGAVTQGSSLEDVIEMAVDCASGWILDELEEGNDLPLPTKIKDIVFEDPEDFANLILLDMDSYAEKYGNKAVRKNCTLPSWLSKKAEAAGVNFSAVLQEALIEKLGMNK